MDEEKDTVSEEPEAGIEIEIEPEPAEAKPRFGGKDTAKLDVSDDEIGQYGQKVQQRIKGLRFAFHEERRIREQAERDLAAASDFARRVQVENAQLKSNVRATEQAVVHQAIGRADAEIQQAKNRSRMAHEAGNTEEIISSNEQLARAVAEKERLNMLKQPVQEEPPPPQQPPQQQAPPPPDARTQEWFAKNTWYRAKGEEERSAVAMAMHNKLVERGISPQAQPDLYWRSIDERLATLFPEKYNGNGNGNGNGHQEAARESTNSRPLAVAGSTRSSATPSASRPRVVKLSESQVRLAHRLGLTVEQYAAQIALEGGPNA